MVLRTSRNIPVAYALGTILGAVLLQFLHGLWLYIRPDKNFAEAVSAVRQACERPTNRTRKDAGLGELRFPDSTVALALEYAADADLSEDQRRLLQRAYEIAILKYRHRPRIDARLMAPYLTLATTQENISKQDEWAHLLAFAMVRPNESAEHLQVLLSSLSIEQLGVLRALRMSRNLLTPPLAARLEGEWVSRFSALLSEERSLSYEDVSQVASEIISSMAQEGIAVLSSMSLVTRGRPAPVVVSFTDPLLEKAFAPLLEELSLLNVMYKGWVFGPRAAKVALWTLSAQGHDLLDIIDGPIA